MHIFTALENVKNVCPPTETILKQKIYPPIHFHTFLKRLQGATMGALKSRMRLADPWSIVSNVPLLLGFIGTLSASAILKGLGD